MKGGMISLEKKAVAADGKRAYLNKIQTLGVWRNAPNR